jgi:6-phosphogluconolactonase
MVFADSPTVSDMQRVAGPSVGGPAALALHPTKPVLYVAPEWGPRTGSLFTFAISANGALKRIGEVKLGGTGSVHIALAPDARTLAVSNYTSGSVSTLTIDEAGKPGKPRTMPLPTKPARAHWSMFLDNSTIVVTNVASDQLQLLDTATAALTPFAESTPGHRARSIAQVGADRIVVSNEIGNSVSCLMRSGTGWKHVARLTLSKPGIPADVLALGDSAVLVAHRGPDEVVEVTVGLNCELVETRRAATGIPKPRSLAGDAETQWIGHESGGLVRRQGDALRTYFAPERIWTVVTR